MCGRCVVCVVCVVASTSVAPSTSVTAAALTTPARGPARQANVQATSNLPASLATLHTCCTNPAMLVRTCINACMLKHGCFFPKCRTEPATHKNQSTANKTVLTWGFPLSNGQLQKPDCLLRHVPGVCDRVYTGDCLCYWFCHLHTYVCVAYSGFPSASGLLHQAARLLVQEVRYCECLYDSLIHV